VKTLFFNKNFFSPSKKQKKTTIKNSQNFEEQKGKNQENPERWTNHLKLIFKIWTISSPEQQSKIFQRRKKLSQS